MPKRILTGTVTSDANAQTVTVSVERRFTHPVLKKTIRKSKNTGLTTRTTHSKWAILFASSNVHPSRKPNVGKF